MKAITILICFACSTALCDSDIDLGGKEITFTNNEGRVYANVLVQRANLDGIVYYTHDGGAGMVKYKDVSTNLIASLNIPMERVNIAAQRATADAARKKQYAQQVQALAIKEQQQQQEEAAIAQSNAVKQAEAQAAAQKAANATGTAPTNKRKKSAN
jgi:hypothetical protein